MQNRAMLPPPIDLVGQGKLWGRLDVCEGRLVLRCRRGQREASFDLLSTLQARRAVQVRTTDDEGKLLTASTDEL